jgi:hypothetical protein
MRRKMKLAVCANSGIACHAIIVWNARQRTCVSMMNDDDDASVTPRDMMRRLITRHRLVVFYLPSHHNVPIAMPQSFRTHIRTWMRGINMPLTPLRELFIRRYQALLVLRGVCLFLPGPRQAAMEVLLNLARHPAKQQNYLRAVIRQIGRLIYQIIDTMSIPADDGTLWDVPGHVPGSLHGYRLGIIADPPGANAMAIEEPVPEVISDDE